MSQWHGRCRTNYFRVTDEERYAELFSHLTGSEDAPSDFTKVENGTTLHTFGCYDSIEYRDGEDADDEFDFFLEEIQKILPKDEAFIYMECGYEKLRYITGLSIVVTHNDMRTIDIRSSALKAAQEMLGNKEFDTRMEY